MKILIVGVGLIGKERITALKKISSNYSMGLDITVVDKSKKLLDEIKDEFKLQVNSNFNDELVNFYVSVEIKGEDNKYSLVTLTSKKEFLFGENFENIKFSFIPK